MNNLNMSDIEQHIQGFHSHLRADYVGKVQEIARLHEEMAKLQTRLLDVEHENHMLKIQLALSKAEGKRKEQPLEPQPTSQMLAPLPPSVKEEKSVHVADESSSEDLRGVRASLKRVRSPSPEIIEAVNSSPKKLKLEVKAEMPAGSHGFATQPEHDEAHNPSENKPMVKSGSPALDDAVGIPSVIHPSPALSPALPDSKEVKVKRQKSESSNVFSLPLSVTDMYLQSAKALEIHPSPLDLEVPRSFLRLEYGGSDQQFFQTIQANRNPSGLFIRNLMFPMLNLNPTTPSQPGDPGLVFASRTEILSNPPWTLFCKRIKNKALWLYLGEYECVRVGTMTAEHFRMQTDIVKQEWAKLLLKQKKHEVYTSMRARIALRLASIIPIDDKEEEATIIRLEVEAIKKHKGRPLSEGDIITAFSNGDEESF